jgi:hypothetical protein
MLLLLLIFFTLVPPLVPAVALHFACRLLEVPFPGWRDAIVYSLAVVVLHLLFAGTGAGLAGCLLVVIRPPQELGQLVLISAALTVSLLAGMLFCGAIYENEFDDIGFGKAILLWLIQVLVTATFIAIVFVAVYVALRLQP